MNALVIIIVLIIIIFIINILVDLEKDLKPKLSPKNFAQIPSLQRTISYGATVESYRQTIADIVSQIRLVPIYYLSYLLFIHLEMLHFNWLIVYIHHLIQCIYLSALSSILLILLHRQLFHISSIPFTGNMILILVSLAFRWCQPCSPLVNSIFSYLSQW